MLTGDDYELLFSEKMIKLALTLIGLNLPAQAQTGSVYPYLTKNASDRVGTSGSLVWLFQKTDSIHAYFSGVFVK